VTPPSEIPFVGLDPFSEEQEDYFFGRELDAGIIASNVLTRPITVLFAASGVGKTSVLRAGLPRALKALHRNPTLDIWRDWQSPDRLISGLESTHRSAAAKRGRPLILVFDQFEDYFLYRPKEIAEKFEDGLATILGGDKLEVHLLLSLRADALYRLDQLRLSLPGVLDNIIELEHLDDAAVREAIEGPIKRYNCEYRKGNDKEIAVEDRLVTTLIMQIRKAEVGFSRGNIASIEARPVELSYLQLALTKLWAEEGGQNATAMTATTLEKKLGGVGGIVRNHVNKVMDGLYREEKPLCALMLDRLVTSIGTKIAYPTEALAEDVRRSFAGFRQASVADVQAIVAAVMDKLTPKEARILRSVDVGGREGFELFHDVLGLPVLEWKRRYQQEVAMGVEARQVKLERDRRVPPPRERQRNGYGGYFWRWPW
jgi:hypothetical protein